MLGDNQEETLFTFLDAIAACMDESHQQSTLESLQQRMDTALALLERDFPTSVQVC